MGEERKDMRSCGFRAHGGLNPVWSKGTRHSGMTRGLKMEGGREDWGPRDNGEEAGETRGSSSGKPQETLSEGVTWQKLVMAGDRWKAGSPTSTEGHAQTLLAGGSSS